MAELTGSALWKACRPMRASGMGFPDHLEQLSGLLFLKACESLDRVSLDSADTEADSLYLPEPYRWDAITGRVHLTDYEYDDEFAKPIVYSKHPSDMDTLERYEEAIAHLKKDGSLARQAFEDFNPLFRQHSTFAETAHNLEKLDGWDSFGQRSDFFGDAYEYFVDEGAAKAGGVGEFFTPKPLVRAMVEFVEPQRDDEIMDPAAGTNRFLIQSYKYITEHIENSTETEHSDVEAQLISREKNAETYRLGLLNYLLHDIDADNIEAMRCDSLEKEKNSSNTYDLVLANPPFGSKSSFQYNDLCDSSIEMNFLVMMMDLLDDSGRAGIVVPEGILFNTSKTPAREKLLNNFNLDVILALPEDTFHPYAGVDANVLFFEQDGEGTDEFWFYDARTACENINSENPLKYDKHFEDFIRYKDNRKENRKYFKVHRDDIDENRLELHLKKYKDNKGTGYRPPAEIAQDIKDEVENIKQELENMGDLEQKTDETVDENKTDE